LSELQQLYETALNRGDISLLGSGGLKSMAQCIGYMLLYNMDNDDGMWLSSFLGKLNQVDHIAGVLNSKPFKFAMSVCVARLRGDFCSFFKLLKAAPYVEACIMTKYLDCSNPRSDGGMRYIAVRALHKTWSGGPRSSKNHVPLSLISDMLCLEEEDCIELMAEFGLQTMQDHESSSGALVVEFCREGDFVGFPHSVKSIEELTAARRYESFVLKKRNPVSGELRRDEETGNFIFELSRVRVVRDQDIDPVISWKAAGLGHISAAAGTGVDGSRMPQLTITSCRPSVAEFLIQQSGVEISKHHVTSSSTSSSSSSSSSSVLNPFAQSEASKKKEEETRQKLIAKKRAEDEAAKEKAKVDALVKQKKMVEEKIRKGVCCVCVCVLLQH
jgi:hypothetical protein